MVAVSQQAVDFVADGFGPGRQVIRRQAVSSVLPQQGDGIALFDIGQMCHLHHGKVHAHPASDRGPAAIDQDPTPVREQAAVAVTVTHRQDRHSYGTRRNIGPAVTDAGPGRQIFELQDLSSKTHDRL